MQLLTEMITLLIQINSSGSIEHVDWPKHNPETSKTVLVLLELANQTMGHVLRLRYVMHHRDKHQL